MALSDQTKKMLEDMADAGLSELLYNFVGAMTTVTEEAAEYYLKSLKSQVNAMTAKDIIPEGG